MAVRIVQVNHLLASGVQPNVVDKDKRGGAHFAAAKGELEILQLLHSKGVDVDAEDAIGRSPMHYAALHDHESVVSFLMTKSAWLDACDATDCTALHLAARGGAATAANRLITLGAKTSLRNRWDLTALGMTLLCDEICPWYGRVYEVAWPTPSEYMLHPAFTSMHEQTKHQILLKPNSKVFTLMEIMCCRRGSLCRSYQRMHNTGASGNECYTRWRVATEWALDSISHCCCLWAH